MRRLAELLEALAAAPHAAARAIWLDEYITGAPDPDRGWAAGWLLGALRPPRHGPARLRALAEARAGDEMFRLSAAALGDVAEAAALIWPGAGDLTPGRVAAGWDHAATLFDQLDAEPRRALARLYAGRRAKGARFAEIRDALARLSGADPAVIAGALAVEAPPYRTLFAWLAGEGPRGDWPQIAPPPLGRLAPGAPVPDTAAVWPAPDGAPVRVIGGRLFDEDGAPIRGEAGGAEDGWGFLSADGYTPAPTDPPLHDPDTHAGALLLRDPAGAWLLRPPAERRLVAPVTFIETGRAVLLTLGVDIGSGEIAPLVRLPAPSSEASAVAAFARTAVVEKFGPVRQVGPGLWAEIAYCATTPAPRRKCGLTLAEARFVRLISGDGPAAPSIDELRSG